MQKLLLTVDKISTKVGQLCAWSIVALTLLIGWEVFNRYVLTNPHPWVMDGSNMLYGVLFMMAGAYTLSKNGHVRGDVLYGFFEPKTQAFFDLILYILFFIGGIIAMVYAGWDFFQTSLAQNEHSSIAANGPPIYPFKAVIPIAGAFLLLQGFVEIIRCIVCLQTGEWPSREEDVEEVDVDKLKAMVSSHTADNK
jgi:TRAP-type mannitol/chloroaromatic compound transport system permease small subunit